MNTFSLGSRIRLSANFKDLNNADIDPTTVTLLIKKPDGTIQTESNTPAKDAVGKYHFDITLSQVGDYFYRYECDGTAIAQAERKIVVQKSNILT